MYKYLIFDLSRKNKAHAWTNDYFIKKLSKTKNIIINLNNNLDQNSLQHNDFLNINYNFNLTRNIILRYFKVFLDVLLIYFKSKKIKNKKIFILSFDNLSILFILSLFNKSNKIYLFCHNNIDKKRKSKIHNFLFSFLKNKKIVLVVYENYIAKSLRNEKFKSIALNHPIRVFEKKIRYFRKEKIIIYHHSDKQNSDLVFTLKNHFKDINYLFISKGNRFSSENLKIRKSYKYSFETLIYNSKFIIIDLDYEYRVSNLFYTLIGLNKDDTKIIIRDCLFSRQMKKKYSNLQIYLFREINEIIFLLKNQT